MKRTSAVWVWGMILGVGLAGEARAEDWRGETVFARQEDLPLRYEERTVGKFSHEARVMRDLGEWVEVRHTEKNGGSYLGCVEKAEVVRANEAVEYFTGAIRARPNSSWAHANRGNAWLARGEQRIAALDLSEALRLEPRAVIYNLLGLLKHDLKDDAGAMQDFDEAIRLDPKLEVAYNNRGIVKSDQKDYAGAIRDYDEAIRLDPKYATAYSNRGVMKRAQKDHAGAIRDYDEAIRLDPEFALFHNNRGFSKHNLKDYAGAIRDYRDAIRLDQKMSSPRCYHAFLLATATDEKIRDAGEALKLAEGVLKEEPTNAYGKNAKACGLALRGDYLEAIRWEREALQDADFAGDEAIDGGKRGLERIAAWEQKKLWLQP